MNKFLLLSASASMLSSAAWLQASPLFSVDTGVDVFFDGSSSLRWSSNVFRDAGDEVDDLLWTVTPGFEVDFGRGASNADFVVGASYEVLNYLDRPDLDAELAHVDARGSYEAARLVLEGSAGFDERQSGSSDRDDVNLDGDLTESEVVSADFSGEYQFSPKFSFGVGVEYQELEYVSDNAGSFADLEEVAVPVNVFYELTPKVDLSLGYSRRDSDVAATVLDAAYDKEVSFYSVGARGELLPKLSGLLQLGVVEVESNRVDDRMFGADLDLDYVISEKLTSSLALSRDYGVAGTGAVTENTSATLRANYTIDAKYSVSANVGYDLREYEDGREDDQYSAGVSLSYVVDQNWRLGAGYTYSETESTQAASSYVDHTFDLSASLRY
jgi:hypothetical protein